MMMVEGKGWKGGEREVGKREVGKREGIRKIL